jgi:hypothetical protein
MLLDYDILRAIFRRNKYTIKINRITKIILAKIKGYLSKNYKKIM